MSLYGQCADFDAINALADSRGLWVMEDAAQSFGAGYKKKRSCSLTKISTTSFFPAKPLGCYGDGGAVFTNDDELIDKVKVIRNHGQEKRYYHSVIGINGRMDTLQAAIVDAKLKYFDAEIERRNKAAELYTELLRSVADTPKVLSHNISTWAQYTIRINDRDSVREALAKKGIPTAVHYPMPLPRQKAFAYLADDGSYPVSDALAKNVLSLPMHGFITDAEVRLVCDALREVL